MSRTAHSVALNAMIAKVGRRVSAFKDELSEARARIAVLEAAIEPFAAVAQQVDGQRLELGMRSLGDDDNEAWWDEVERLPAPADFRAAAAARKGKPEHVHIGDIWRVNELQYERFVRVISIDADGQYARIRTCDRNGSVNPMNPLTRAMLSRFGKGYVRP